MAENIVKYANAVCEKLSAYSAELSLVPDYSLPEMKTQRCVVVPIGIEKKRVSRQLTEIIFRIDVAILNKIKTKGEIEKRLLLLEDVSDLLLGANIASGLCIKTEFAPLYAVEMVLQKNLFVGVLALSIKVVK